MLFPPNSRYAGVPQVTFVDGEGQALRYLEPRFAPGPSGGYAQEVKVQQGERLDLIAARTLGDPLLFWHLCDGNAALDPFELVRTPGRTLQVAQPAVFGS